MKVPGKAALRPAHLSVFGTLAGVVVIVAFAGLLIAERGREAGEVQEAVAPRYARLAGLRESAAAVEQAAAAATAALDRFAYPVTMSGDRIGTDLQQRLRAAAEAAGVGVINSQIGTGKRQADLEDVPVSMTLEAEIGQLRQMLLAVQTQSGQAPAIFIDNLGIQRQRSRAGDGGRLTVQARFSVLRRVP